MYVYIRFTDETACTFDFIEMKSQDGEWLFLVEDGIIRFEKSEVIKISIAPFPFPLDLDN